MMDSPVLYNGSLPRQFMSLLGMFTENSWSSCNSSVPSSRDNI